MNRINIYLVRHGESEGNLDPTLYQKVPDHAVPLSERGRRQAADAGRFLAEHFFKNPPRTPVRLWTSPYARTRQTADEIMAHCPQIADRREHINLCEQQFGLFDGIPDEDLPKRFPDEHAHYEKCLGHEGRFWARMPLGESRFDVAVRVHQAFGTFHRDAQSGVRNLVIVGHGVTIRAFVMQWLHLTPEWFDRTRNPANCSIWQVFGTSDCGLIYPGGTP